MTVDESTQSATTFKDLELDDRVQKALMENGFEKPFPIQEAAIPLILQGKDVIGQAHTGTGKTAAFALPVLTRIRSNIRSMQTLVLVPTRELAMQVTNEFMRFSKQMQIWTVSIYGGQSFGLQAGLIKKGAQIVVATPGRLIDHMERGTVRLDTVKCVILDEADRMLDMGFIEDIEFILSKIGKTGTKDRQTLLFSATMSQEILRLAKSHMREGSIHEIRLNRQEVGLDKIDQSYLLVKEQQKFGQLIDIIREHKHQAQQQAIVFAATKHRVDKLASNLKSSGFRVSAIHGDLSQKERDNVMYRFRKGADNVLVATDIAARGIDVPAVGHVINYDVPNEPETYFHRIGRTARAGGEGKATSLVTPDRFGEFSRILKQTKLPINRLNEAKGIDVPAMHVGYTRQNRGNQSYGWRKDRSRRNSDIRTWR